MSQDCFELNIISYQGHQTYYRVAAEALLSELFKKFAKEHLLPLDRMSFRYNCIDIERNEKIKVRDLILNHRSVIYASIKERDTRESFELEGQELGG